MIRRQVIVLGVIAAALAGCAELDRPFQPTREPARARVERLPVAQASADPAHTGRRQYYDQRRQRYYFYDPGRRGYFWEDGSPKT